MINETYDFTRDDSLGSEGSSMGPHSGNKTLDFTKGKNLSSIIGGDKHFVFTQGVASDTWIVNHSLHKYPSVTVVDSGNNTVVGCVTYNDLDNLTITFGSPFSGKAYIN